jgi:hypothetical protein
MAQEQSTNSELMKAGASISCKGSLPWPNVIIDPLESDHIRYLSVAETHHVFFIHVLNHTFSDTLPLPESTVVRMKDDDLDQGLVRGDQGVIVDCMDEAGETYMVEFGDIQDPTAVGEDRKPLDGLVTVVKLDKLEIVSLP